MGPHLLSSRGGLSGSLGLHQTAPELSVLWTHTFWEVVCKLHFCPQDPAPQCLMFPSWRLDINAILRRLQRTDAQPFNVLFPDLSFLLKTIVPVTRHFGYAGAVACRIL